jgi:hypothetical protein
MVTQNINKIDLIFDYLFIMLQFLFSDGKTNLVLALALARA